MSLRTIFSIVWIIQAARSEYYVEQLTLNETRPECSVAVPNIIYLARGNSLQLTDDDVHIADNTSVIVGYVERMKTFRYVGCVVDSDIPTGVKKKINITSDPGQCYTVCNYSNWFGVSVESCYCFQWPFQGHTNYAQCTQLCSYPKGALCGRSEPQHRYISLYENVSYNGTLDIGEEAHCLACKKTTCRWTNCTTKHRGVCNGTNLGSSNITVKERAAQNTWADFTNLCLQRHGLPKMPPRDPSVFGGVNGDEYLWTGVIRSLVIEKRNEVPVKDFRHDYIGYIVKEGPRFHLKFAHTNVTVTGKYLCYSDGTRTPPSIQTQPSTSGATSTTAAVATSPTASQHINNTTGYTSITETELTDSLTTPALLTTASTLSTTDSLITTTLQRTADSLTTERNGPAIDHNSAVNRTDADINDEGHSSSMIIVYVATPLTVVGLAIGIGCFIRWNRMRRRGNTGQTVLYSKSTTTPTNRGSYNGHVADNSTAIQDHNYFVLEKTNNYSSIKAGRTSVTSHSGSPATDYSEPVNDYDTIYTVDDTVDEDTYDHTDARGIRQGDVDDTYNRTLQSGSDDYDTAMTSTRPRIGSPNVDDTYDHAVSGNEDEYNTTASITMARGSDAFESTYDHVGKSK